MKKEGVKAGSSKPRTILVAVAGGSPAIITETLWALAKRADPVNVDEVRVLTTAKGQAAILNSLLSPTDGKFKSCLKELEVTHPIKFLEKTIFVFKNGKGGELNDIRTDEDNQLAADQICGFIREWTKEDSRLICSAAGGRKTMSIYLTIAMMLYGRADDRLFHVLVNPEEFESCRDFFHPYRIPQDLPLYDRAGTLIKTLSTALATLDLGEIPFVKMRVLDTGKLFGTSQTYSDIVDSVQQRLEFLGRASSSELKIGQAGFIRARIPIEVGGRTCHLPPAQGLIYALVAENRKRTGEGVELDLISSRDLRRIYRRLTGAEYSPYLEETQFKFLVNWIGYLTQKDRESLNKFREAVTVSVSRANDGLALALFPKQFLIQNLNEGKPRGRQSSGAMYTINLPGEAIRLPFLAAK
jgi:CRISPR-associated protein (TIGR02584 family)